MAGAGDVLKPGIHAVFAYSPHETDVKCTVCCADKRFVSVDDASNVALWVRQKRFCWVTAGLHMQGQCTMSFAVGSVLRSGQQSLSKDQEIAEHKCHRKSARRHYANSVCQQVQTILCSLSG